MKKPLLSEMTLEEKIGQMLLGYQYHITRKSEIDAKIFRTAEEKSEYLKNEKFGSLYAQTGHLKTTTATNMDEGKGGKDNSKEFGEFIQWESDQYKIPALTCLDAEAEGAGTLFEDLTTTCRPIAMGATNDENLAYDLGAAIARELRTAGVNWRWTPVVDVSSRFSNGCSMLRSYAQDDPEKQGRLALAHAKGMQSEGVAATAKHFPGGDTIEYRDSHFTRTMINSTKEEWWEEQGKIFQHLIDGGVYSIMISHKSFPAVDDSKVSGSYRPCTISKKVITDLLKGEMGFKGVVITDGFVMASLYSLLPYDELIVEMVNAGNDVLLGPHIENERAMDIIIKAIENGKIPEERINDACQRVLDMKEKLGMFEDGYRLVKGKSEEVTDKTREINMEIARKAVTLIRDRDNMLPLNKGKIKNVAIICSAHIDSFFSALNVLKNEFETRGAKVHMQRRLTGFDEIKKIADEYDLIIYAAYVAGHQPMGGPFLFGEECATYFYAYTAGREKSIGVSFGYPYIHYDIMENADTFVNAYGKSPELMKAFVEGIYGEIPFVGESPVNLETTIRKW